MSCPVPDRTYGTTDRLSRQAPIRTRTTGSCTIRWFCVQAHCAVCPVGSNPFGQVEVCPSVAASPLSGLSHPLWRSTSLVRVLVQTLPATSRAPQDCLTSMWVSTTLVVRPFPRGRAAADRRATCANGRRPRCWAPLRGHPSACDTHWPAADPSGCIQMDVSTATRTAHRAYPSHTSVPRGFYPYHTVCQVRCQWYDGTMLCAPCVWVSKPGLQRSHKRGRIGEPRVCQ
jgi:hypothetical protein